MEDPVEINRRIERLLKRVRRRDDYGELLFSGEVIRSRDGIDDPGEWRAAIRKRARADRIKIRTGETASKVWALVNSPRSSDVLLEGRRFFVLADRAIGEAESRGHEARVAFATVRRLWSSAIVAAPSATWMPPRGSRTGRSSKRSAAGESHRNPDSSPRKGSVLFILRPGRGSDLNRVVEEVSHADPVVEQVDVGAQGEGGVGVAEPNLDLLDVLAV